MINWEEESTTYQWILKKVELAATCRLITRLGTSRCGTPPTPAQVAALAAVADLGVLERTADRINSATRWDDLLATP